MIRLIDLSGELWSLLMLTAGGISSGLWVSMWSGVRGGTTPPATEDIQVGVRLDGDNHPIYSLAEGAGEDVKALRSLQDLRDGLTRRLADTTGQVRKLTIHADRRVQYKVVRDMVQ